MKKHELIGADGNLSISSLPVFVGSSQKRETPYFFGGNATTARYYRQ